MKRTLAPLGRRLLAAVVVVSSAVGCTGGSLPKTSSDRPLMPGAMAALGDSITRAFAACGQGGDCVEMSWATGTAGHLDSHAQRLDIADSDSGQNFAVSGARVAGLASQVEAAVRVRPDYLTVLIGANDACARDEAGMTSVLEYRNAFEAALDTLVQGLPDARILVVSVPDLRRLWELGKDRPEVRRVWESSGVCQSMLADPTDPSAAAQARRDRVRARIQAYNDAMASACARHAPQCRDDGNTVFDYRFDLDDVSTLDYWHPSSLTVRHPMRCGCQAAAY
jgi:lysophospholipase L1-like esterase